MANGKRGDHPLTDIIGYRDSVYGAGADDLIRKIAALSSRQELDEWWQREIGWNGTGTEALPKARTQYDSMVARAKANGWELPEGAT